MTVSLTTSPSASITAGLPAPYSRMILAAAERSRVVSLSLRITATKYSIASLQWTPAYARVVTADRARPRFGSFPVICHRTNPAAYYLFNDSQRDETKKNTVARAKTPPHNANRLAYGFKQRSHLFPIASAPQSQTVPPNFRHSARISYSTTWIFQSSSTVRRFSGSRLRGISSPAANRILVVVREQRRVGNFFGLGRLGAWTTELGRPAALVVMPAVATLTHANGSG